MTDVAPDGTSKELSGGWLAASFRALDKKKKSSKKTKSSKKSKKKPKNKKKKKKRKPTAAPATCAALPTPQLLR